MKLRAKKTTALIALLLLCASLFGVYASAATKANYDSSVNASSGNVTLSAVDVLESYIGSSIGDDERAFFDTVSATGVVELVEVSYNEIINTGKANIDYSNGKLIVTAYEYEYVGVNNKSFLWIPDSVSFAEKNVQLSKRGDVYECEIECSEPENKESVKIAYRASVELSADDVNEILNIYRNTAEYVYNKDKYDAYLIEKKLYDDAKAKYDKYLLDLAEFEALTEAFETYDTVTIPKYNEQMAQYQEYEDKKKTYDAELAAYNAYLKEYSKIEKQLDAVRLIDVTMAMGRNVYGAVMGGAVDEVLGRQGDLVAAGAQLDAVELAGDATVRVRQLMTEFKAQTTDRDKYIYYTNNYDNFCDSFLDLTRALDVLYRNRLVRAAIIVRDKNPQYILLVAQLALICNALIDGEIRDYNGKIAYTSTWTIDGKTILQILENKTYYVDDDTSTPIQLPEEVKKPDDLVAVSKPTYPERPAKPIEPVPVSNPGNAPAIVANPDLSLKHSFLPAIYNALDAAYKENLKSAFTSSDIPSQRPNVSGDFYSITLNTKINKLYGASSVEVTFKLPDGSVSVIKVDENSPVVCEAKIPESYVDDFGDTRVLVGWAIEESLAETDTGAVDLMAGFEKNVILVPLYQKYCNVTWEINGKTYSEVVSVLDDAVCPVVPAKADEGSLRYEFAGWIDEDGNNIGNEIGKPDKDSKYVASFEKKYIVPYSADGKNGAKIEYEENLVVCDASNYFGQTGLDISGIIKRAVEKQSALNVKTIYGTLKFTFTDVLTLFDNDVETVKVNYSGNQWVDEYLVIIADKEANTLDIKLEFEANSRAEDVTDYQLFKLSEMGEKVYVKNVYDSGVVTFDVESGVKYVYRAEYFIQFNANEMDLVDFKISNTTPFLNEDVSYEIIPKSGVKVVEILIEDISGTPVFVKEDGSRLKGTFRVLGSDVAISVRVVYETYTVTYKSNGKVFYQQTVQYGTVPTPPTPPKLSNDSTYSYKFAGWSAELTPVTCDVTYEAVYEKTPLPPKEELDLALSSDVKKILYVAIAGVVLFVAFAAVLTTFVVKRCGKRRCRKIGFDSYPEYKANRKLEKAMLKFKKCNEKMKYEAKNPARRWKLLKKASNKVTDAEAKLKKAIEKQVEKEVKRGAKGK